MSTTRFMSPARLVVAGVAFLGAALGAELGTFATVHPNEYCMGTPVPGHVGNCNCEVPGNIWACEQSFEFGAMHTDYYCVGGTGSCDDTPTTWCGEKYKCSPACDAPNRVCTPQAQGCPTSVQYGCTTI